MTNPTVAADMDNPQDERNSLWVRGPISLLATYRLAKNHVHRITTTNIAKSCEPITLLWDTHTMANLNYIMVLTEHNRTVNTKLPTCYNIVFICSGYELKPITAGQ